MAPTLPTELIKHIFELLYDDVRSLEPYNPDPPFGKMDGEYVAFIFQPLFFVSKTFFALSLPILGRHLFRTSSDNIATQQTNHMLAAIASLQKRGLKRTIESLTLPPNLSATHATDVLRDCGRLDTLHLFTFEPRVHTTPSTITTLLLTSTSAWESVELSTLVRAFPRVTNLWLEGCSRGRFGGALYFHVAPVSRTLGWSLQSLVLRDFAGGDDELMALLQQAAPTLETLSLSNDHDQLIRAEFDETSIGTVFARLTTPFPRLRRLMLGELTSLSDTSVVLHRDYMPQLVELRITIDDSSIDLLLNLPNTITRAFFTVAEMELDAESDEVDIFLTFVHNQPKLQLLTVDLTPWNFHRFDDWSADLRDLCAERGIAFGCYDVYAKEEGGEDYLSELSEADRCFDFDAEDDEMWAQQWSEEKRQAMGLAPILKSSQNGQRASDPAPSDDEKRPSEEHGAGYSSDG